ncbi:alpha/beta hydrolase-fold protein [Mariniflexile litorale]|uniref:Alpha/beta hydrolase-fold protein n=1 Tax=Mariniflexile litorale TaxID=3045158 RepID=A0AAU7EIV5_9FLAO|nr:alpha/beta hydrolase-fold protein [Mariniflexile sp. KMM 9835]MDQ8211106.1 alpha/beta hydrolase-fold protein [Mariniflexile sp. KMM 9835]
MKHLLFVILVLCSITSFNAQVKYETIESAKLGETRELKIQFPRGYNPSDNTKYPLFIVLDGDYLFEAVAGNIDYYSYWEDMPASIVVGINQFDKRYDDCMYAEQNSLPIDAGANFFEFIGMELIPHLEKKYKTDNFRVIVGHGETANFINYFLLKPDPLFKGYMAISPELAPNMITYITDALRAIPSKTFYYLANTNNDSSSMKQMTDALHTDISALNNKNLFYKFNNFEKPSHYSVSTHAIPNAIESIFKVFQPISKEEYTKTILNLEGSPVEYLQEKYKAIHELFGIKKRILINDFKAISAAIEKTRNFEYYEVLGKMARDEYPKTLLGSYYLARFYEEAGEPKKAMRTYETAFTLDEIAGFTKDFMLEKAEAIKTDFGY